MDGSETWWVSHPRRNLSPSLKSSVMLACISKFNSCVWPVPATKAPFFTLASMHQIQMLLPVEREKIQKLERMGFLSGPAQKINQEKGGTQDNSIAQKKPNIFLKSWSIMSSCCTISQAEQLVSPLSMLPSFFYFHVGGHTSAKLIEIKLKCL